MGFLTISQQQEGSTQALQGGRALRAPGPPPSPCSLSLRAGGQMAAAFLVSPSRPDKAQGRNRRGSISPPGTLGRTEFPKAPQQSWSADSPRTIQLQAGFSDGDDLLHTGWTGFRAHRYRHLREKSIAISSQPSVP